MNISEAKIEVVRPDIFKEGEGIAAWFTLRNANLFSDNRNIAGLNLGLNTSESEEVVRNNRTALFENLQLSPDWVAFGNQVHGNRIQVISRGGTYTETDGFVTRVPRLALAIQVADCAAVLLGDSRHRVIAAVHAGWKGAAGGIVPRAIKYMTAQGARPGHIKAFVSPCISKRRFEVGHEVARQFPEAFVDYESYEKPHVDLKGFIRHQLIEKGVKPEHIEIHSGCTVSSDSYYSYRRQDEQSGRMAGIIQLLKRYEY